MRLRFTQTFQVEEASKFLPLYQDDGKIATVGRRAMRPLFDIDSGR